MKALLGLLALAVVGSSTAPSSTDNVQPSSGADFDAIVRDLGKPIPFDRVFADAQAIPRFRGEFETSAQFEERRAAALAKCQQRYLIEAPVDPEYVRYDADKQVLIVAIYALTNTSASSDELSSVFGYGSELSKAGTEIKYDILGSGNVIWPLPREQRDVGTYDGSNAFGATVPVTKQEQIARGVFDRQGKHRESVWTETPEPYVKDSPPVAFEIKADPQGAKALKQGGLRAAILVAPKAPFYATGVDHFAPTIRAPYDRTTEVRYLIADIECAALYDTGGELLATRATR
jgi:hypothetical protein